MIAAPFKVVLDANVLYPFTLRDTLLRAAAAGLFQVYWSEQILDETVRNLKSDGRMKHDQAVRLLAQMKRAFPEAEVAGHEPLIATMTNDPKDRHVAAAALKIGAQVIVTMNMTDFQSLPEGIEAQTPDEFLENLFDLDRGGMVELLERQAGAMKKPSVTVEELIRGLSRVVPQFAAAVRAHRAGADEPDG